jgi:hypothetical protein
MDILPKREKYGFTRIHREQFMLRRQKIVGRVPKKREAVKFRCSWDFFKERRVRLCR